MRSRCGVDDAVLDVQHEHLAEHDVALRARLQGDVAPAFHADRRRGDPARSDRLARQQLEAGEVDLADLGRQVDRAEVHRRGERLVDQIDHELAAVADVVGGVLGAAPG